MTTVIGGKNLRKAMNTPIGLTLQMQKTHTLDAEVARVSVRIENVFHKYINEEALEAAVEKAFPGTRYLRDSVHRLSASDKNLFGIYLSKKRHTMPVEQASAEGLTPINDTVYQDANDGIWTVIRDGETSYLAMQVDDNINDLLGGLHVRSVATASHGMSLEEDYSAGNAVMYYDTQRAEKAFGIAVDGAHVYNPDRKAIVPVEAAQVMVVDDANRVTVEISAGMRTDKKELIEYMRMLYGHNEAFFAELKAVINKFIAV